MLTFLLFIGSTFAEFLHPDTKLRLKVKCKNLYKKWTNH